jgi:ATP adenylyltransferase
VSDGLAPEPTGAGRAGTGDQPHAEMTDLPHLGEVARDTRSDQPGVGIEGLQRLWAPWRFGYIAGADPVEGCPFCVLPARGREHDRASLILHRGQHNYVICNAYPYNPGHLMVVPYEHRADLEHLDEDVATELFALGRVAVRALKTRVGAQGINLGMNLGAVAGAGITDHLHLHAVPRWGGDTNFMSVVGAARVLPKALEELYDELLPGFPSDA